MLPRNVGGIGNLTLHDGLLRDTLMDVYDNIHMVRSFGLSGLQGTLDLIFFVCFRETGKHFVWSSL
jgi:hypothetical protein